MDASRSQGIATGMLGAVDNQNRFLHRSGRIARAFLGLLAPFPFRTTRRLEFEATIAARISRGFGRVLQNEASAYARFGFSSALSVFIY